MIRVFNQNESGTRCNFYLMYEYIEDNTILINGEEIDDVTFSPKYINLIKIYVSSDFQGKHIYNYNSMSGNLVRPLYRRNFKNTRESKKYHDNKNIIHSQQNQKSKKYISLLMDDPRSQIRFFL